MLASCAGTSEGSLESAVDAIFSGFGGETGASVGIFRDGRILLAKGYGAATAETNYRLASVTKQFTAMAVAILKARGRLSYEDPAGKYLSGLPPWGAEVTLRHLLGHTSGIADYEDHIPRGRAEQLLDRDVLAILRGCPETSFPPGSRFKYSNSGYALLALVVESASGRDFAGFLKEEIFVPLGMAGTVAYEGGKSEVLHRAYGHEQKDGRWIRADQSPTSAVLGDGGIYSSVLDYFKWDRALYAERLVPAKELEELFRPGRLADGTSTRYGFGWRIDGERFFHEGSTIGFSNAVARIPSRRLTAIVLTNRGAEGSAARLLERVLEAVTSRPPSG